MVSCPRSESMSDQRMAQQLFASESGLSREPIQRLVVRCTRAIKPAEEGRQLDGDPEVQLRPSPGSGDRASDGVVTEKAVLHGVAERSLTWDRGREMAEHHELAARLAIDVYFCDPRSPWQRGSNKNANRLLRQYLAKGADLRRFSLRGLDDIARRINTWPRRVLDWATSAELFWPARPRGVRPVSRWPTGRYRRAVDHVLMTAASTTPADPDLVGTSAPVQKDGRHGG